MTSTDREHAGQPSVTSIAPIGPASFRRIFDAELGYVWGSLRRLGVAEKDVEDIAHDVFLHVYRKFASFDPERPVRPWLFAFAFRAASEYRRKPSQRAEVLIEPSDMAIDQELADAQLARDDDAKLIAEALESVDLDRRAVLIAYEVDELAMKDIAEALGIPLHTAYSRLRVARAEFGAAVHRLRLQRGRHE